VHACVLAGEVRVRKPRAEDELELRGQSSPVGKERKAAADGPVAPLIERVPATEYASRRVLSGARVGLTYVSVDRDLLVVRVGREVGRCLVVGSGDTGEVETDAVLLASPDCCLLIGKGLLVPRRQV